jgi:hypothetical protein
MVSGEWLIYLVLRIAIDHFTIHFAALSVWVNGAMKVQPGLKSRLTNPVAKDEISFYLLFLNQNQLL